MTVLYVNPAILLPNPWNSNQVSPASQEKLDESLRRLGTFKPVVVRELSDGSLQILGGEHRVKSAIRIGLTEIPAFNVGTIDDAQAKEISLVDNGRYGADDAFRLNEVLKSLPDLHELPTFMPITDTEIQHLFQATQIDLDSLELTMPTVGQVEVEIPEPASPSKIRTHEMFRFKVPAADAHRVQTIVEAAMKAQGFTQEDSLTNAGNALVHLLLSTQQP